LRHRALGLLARVGLRLVDLLPNRAARRVGGSLAQLIRALVPGEACSVRKHLAMALPETSQTEREALAREVFASAAHTLVEAVQAHKLSPERLKAIVDEPDDTHRAAAMAYSPGGGIIASTPHLGNWELFARYCTAVLGHRALAIARRQRDEVLQELLEQIRERNGLEQHHRGDSVRPLVRALREGALVAALPDQSIKGPSVPVSFFGREAPAHPGVAELAIIAKVAILPTCLCRRRAKAGEEHWGGWRYTIEYGAPILPTDASGERRGPTAMTEELHASLESFIRAQPGQWMWFHNRWKINAKKPR